MRIATLVLLLALLFSVGVVQAQTPVPQDMPTVVLRAAQTLNAQYGPIVDLNNVVWDYTYYDQLDKAVARCPNLGQQPPPLPAGATAYIVELKPVRDGLWGHEAWFMLVYSDLSLITSCKLPPTPTPTPTLRPFTTAVPPTITPPPTGTPTPSYCPGVLSPRLVIRQQGRVVAGGLPNIIRSIPGISGDYLGEIPPGGIFTVLDGPRCFSGYAWWQVNYNGVIGWTTESDSQDYWLESADAVVMVFPTAAAPTRTLPPPANWCNANAPARLRIGEYAQVTPGYPNNMRAAPGTSSTYVGEIAPQEPFLVLDGPQCASEMAWWKVNYKGLVGWTPEGKTSDDYWLEPLASVITPDNITQLHQASTVQLGTTQQLTIVPNTAYQFTMIDANSTWVYAAGLDTAGNLSWQPAPAGESLPGRLAPQTAFTPIRWPLLIPVVDNENSLLLSGYGDGPVAMPDSKPTWTAVVQSHGQWIAASVDGNLRVWSTDGIPQTLSGGAHTGPVELVRFSLDGLLLASSSTSETILWDISTWTVYQTINDGVESSDQLALKLKYLALSDSSQPGVRLYDIFTGASATLPTTGTVTALAFDPTNYLLVTADMTGQIQVWYTATGDLVTTLVERGTPIRELAFSPKGDALFILDENGVVSVWLTGD